MMTVVQMIVGVGIAWNLLVGLAYAWDKYCAVRGYWRVSEKTLLTLAILGGGCGAFLSAQLCHHKTRKWYFHLAWWIGIVLSACVFYLIVKKMAEY